MQGPANLLRPAIEAALAVAREGASAVPPVVPPLGLRRYLGFTKMSPATVRAVARVVDSDDEFRRRVAESVEEDSVGRAGWLWLQRPDGWDDELTRLQGDAAASAAEQAEDRAEHDARRRLAAARAAAERASAAATALEHEAAEVRAEMVEERARRRAAESHAGDLEGDLQRALSGRLEAVRQLKDVEARLAERSAELREVRARLRELEHGVAKDVQPVEPPPVPSPGVLPDPLAVAKAVAAAAQGAADLATALRDLEAVVSGSTARLDDSDRSTPTRLYSPIDLDDDDSGVLPRRRAQALPGGVMDDSVEAVDHLFRVPGILVLVDGYNVSMAGWPELRVAEQRRRLLGALGETAARTGAAVEVVFDGADVEPVGLPGAGRQLVRVRFSPPGVEADDVVLDLVEQLPPARPVVVASSDNRVRTGARRLGANLVHADQLLRVLRR